MKIDLQELIDKGVVSEDVASSISSYYIQKQEGSPNRVLLIFAVLGALLIGLGVILIIGHNWDNFPRIVKTLISFLPLLLTQAIAFYVLLKKGDNQLWKEGSAVALFCSIGASIALVSQVYHIVGDLPTYILTWMVLAIPLIYLLDSKAVLSFVIMGITSYAQQIGFEYPRAVPYLYWLILACILPYFYRLYTKERNSNSFGFLLWLVVGSITIVIGTLSTDYSPSFVLMYMSYFTTLYLIGSRYESMVDHLFKNPFKVIGFLGTIIILLITSFDFYWNDLETTEWRDTLRSATTGMWILLTIVSSYLLVKEFSRDENSIINPLTYTYFIFLLLFLVQYLSPSASQIGINILLLSIAVSMIWRGHDQLQLHLLNLGLLVLVALITCRFFDVKISFVIRGIIFVLLGISFFIANYLIIKKKNAHES